jgi:hypothetical protein
LERDRKKRDQEFDRVFAAQMAKDDAESRRYLGITEPKKEVAKSTGKPSSSVRPATGPSTIRARSAATALATADRPTPRFGASSATAKTRPPTGLISGRKTPNAPVETTAARQARQVSAAVSSKSTIGYAQGRAVRSTSGMRPPLSNVTKPADPNFSTTRRPGTTTPSFGSSHQRSASAAPTSRTRLFSRSSSLSTSTTLVASPTMDLFGETAESAERELELLALQDDMGDDEAWMNSFTNQLNGGSGGGDPVDEELEGFQLQLPEGI